MTNTETIPGTIKSYRVLLEMDWYQTYTGTGQDAQKKYHNSENSDLLLEWGSP